MDTPTGQTTSAALRGSLFRPRSVGLVGLSSDPARPTGRPLEYLRWAGFGGVVYVVNPMREEVQGVRAYASLGDLPEVPEHVYVLLGTDLAGQAVADCAAAGVKVVTVLADGFAEAGPSGAARQREMVAVARGAGMRLLGPNSMGLADLHSGAWITVNAIYSEPEQLVGRVALLSQSGSMMGGLISRAQAIGLGFSKSVGVGNEADLSVGEIGLACVDDPETDVFLLFLETIRDADRLAAFAAAAQAAGKPVIAYKLGRSAVGQQLAVAHTGALLSDDVVVDAYLRDVGIARVHTLDGLIEAATLFAGQRPLGKRDPVVGVMTTTGGGGAAVCDRLALAGARIEPASAPTIEAIRATGLKIIEAPMTDLTLAGAQPRFVKAAVEAMARDPKFDVVVSVTGSSARSSTTETMAPLIEAHKNGKPFGAFLTPEAAAGLRMLIEAGVPAFRTPESCADAVGALLRWQAPRAGIAPHPSTPRQGAVVDERTALALLEALGVPVVTSVEIAIAEAGSAALPFAWPVVAKVLSDAVPHKTEAGGVIVGIDGPEALADAAQKIAASVATHHPGVSVDRLLVQPMVSGLQEVLLGYWLDPQVGPVVTLALGGVLVGLYDDKSVRLAPVDEATAAEMMGEVIGLAPLRGHRGLPKGDLAALAQALAAFSRLAEHVEILEADANPVMVMATGVVAVDALIVMGG
ncbi:MAG TPA: acetate--CoA ligase family protein [Thermohalobaculum sp.]|nr:acetate--CoA ligase family protein [Thermohalobaculum sp.]